MKREAVILSLLVCASLTLAAGTASAAVEGILGKWTAKAITPTGPLELELEIKMEAAQLVGTLVGFQESVQKVSRSLSCGRSISMEQPHSAQSLERVVILSRVKVLTG